MRRFRFYTNGEDPRPILWPLPEGCCYWITGQECGGDECATVVAFMPNEDRLREFWPDAERVDDQGEQPVRFTDRFPRPDYFVAPVSEEGE